jgi:anti-sigma B factor antagonist
MKLTKQTNGDLTVITMAGSLDSSTAAGARTDLERLLPACGTTVLDLGQVSYMSSAGLRVLLLVYRMAQRTGTRIALTQLPADVREIMAATGFLEFFSVLDAEEAVGAQT